MKSIFKHLVLFFFALSALQVQAQVTIGSAKAPIAGALLMLDDGTTGSNNETASKGLGMPRVELTKLKPTTPAELSASIGSTGDWNLTEHTGLIVYNVKDAKYNPLTCKRGGAGPAGLYVWDGTTWVGLGVPVATDGNEDLRTVTDDGSKITLSYNGEVTEYRYSSFGAAGTWMTDNLATQYLPDGTALIKSIIRSNTDPRYFIPGNKATIIGKEGLLYNWRAAMNSQVCAIDQTHVGAGSTVPGVNEVESLEESSPGAKDGKIQGICPTGWHIPSDREWNKLEKEIATKASLYSLSTLDGTWDSAWEIHIGWRGAHGRAMTSKDTKVNGNNTGGDSKPAGSGGLDLLLTGAVVSSGVVNYGIAGYLWSSSSHNSTYPWTRLVHNIRAEVSKNEGMQRGDMSSVRCKKDTN